MEFLISGVDWVAIIVGAVLAFGLGALWYSPKMFGTRWTQDNNLSMGEGSMLQPMLAQGVATFLLAWLIGVTAALNDLALTVLITFTIAALIKTNGLWANKTKYVIMVDSLYIVAMVVIMVLVHAVI